MIHFDWGLRPTSIFVIENQTQYQKRQTDAIHNMCFTTVRTILSYAMASSDWFTTVKSQLATYKICAYLNQSHTQLLRCEPNCIFYFLFHRKLGTENFLLARPANMSFYFSGS